MSTGGKIAIGCGVVFLILALIGAFIVYKVVGIAKDFADDPARGMAWATEMAIGMDPDLEMVKRDDEARTLTFRDTKTGETTTWNYADIEKGRVSLTDSEGRQFQIGALDISRLPNWLPRYPGSSNMTGGISDNNGTLNFSTKDSPESIISFYSNAASELGMEETNIGNAELSQIGMFSKMAHFTTEDRSRTLTIIVHSDNQVSDSIVSVTYEDKE